MTDKEKPLGIYEDIARDERESLLEIAKNKRKELASDSVIYFSDARDASDREAIKSAEQNEFEYAIITKLMARLQNIPGILIEYAKHRMFSSPAIHITAGGRILTLGTDKLHASKNTFFFSVENVGDVRSRKHSDGLYPVHDSMVEDLVMRFASGEDVIPDESLESYGRRNKIDIRTDAEIKAYEESQKPNQKHDVE